MPNGGDVSRKFTHLCWAALSVVLGPTKPTGGGWASLTQRKPADKGVEGRTAASPSRGYSAALSSADVQNEQLHSVTKTSHSEARKGVRDDTADCLVSKGKTREEAMVRPCFPGTRFSSHGAGGQLSAVVVSGKKGSAGGLPSHFLKITFAKSRRFQNTFLCFTCHQPGPLKAA